MKNILKLAPRYPTKVSINLAYQARVYHKPKNVILISVLLILIVLFGKFAVADRFTHLREAEEALGAAEALLTELQASNAQWDAIAAEYQLYSYQSYSDEEKALVDRMEIFNLVEQHLMTVSKVSNLSLKGNTLSATLSGLTLKDTSYLIQNLRSSPIVQDVSIFTAATASVQSDVMNNVISMTITLKRTDKVGDAQ